MAGTRTSETFSCVLIGEHSLLRRCGELLLDRGHRIEVVVSPDPLIREWAVDHGLAARDFGPDLAAALGARPFDYLFSIANLRMLPASVLATARRMPINFHDALLPRHAGVHATSWAIVHRERRHGVTWHVMSAEADAGDVLAQRAFDVDARETAYTLNLKCLEAGAESFEELVDELARRGETRAAQDLGARTYHGRFDRLPHAGLVAWAQSAEEVDAAVRACDFGPQPNTFGTVKLAGAGEVLLVRSTDVSERKSVAPPGTVVDLSGDALVVATTTQDVHLRGLTAPSGALVDAAWLASRGIATGWRFDDPTAAPGEHLTAAATRAAQSEAFWLDQLARSAPLRFEHDGQTADLSATDAYTLEIDLQVVPGWPFSWTVAAIAAALVRATGEDECAIALRLGDQSSGDRILDHLFERDLTFTVPKVDEALTFAGYAERVTHELNVIRSRAPYTRDLTLRYPNLSAKRPSLVVSENHQVRLTASERVLPRDAAEALAASMRTFCAEAAKSPATAVTKLPLVTSAERHRLLVEWNDTAAAYPRDLSVRALFEEQARRRPDAPAVVYEGTVISYDELDRRASQLATFLRGRGIGPGSIVAIYLDRSADVLVALLGVLESGAAYLPLDVVYPRDRMAFMLADAAASLVITESRLEGDLPPEGPPGVAIDREWDVIAAQPATHRHDAVAPDRLAYVIYTSGSTGQPKGVCVPHRALTNLVCSMANTPGCAAGDRLLAVTTTCFDIAALELFVPLITGAQVEIAPSRVVRDGWMLRDWMERARPTLMQATPSTWRMLVAAGWEGDAGLVVLCGGEALPGDLAQQLVTRARQVWNLYGPTETTIWSAVDRVEPGSRITIGRPIANTQLYVADRWMQLVPPGMAGELYIGGDGVAHGYMNRPDLSRAKFVPDCFTSDSDRRLFRTGDLVRHLPDGRLEYLNRLDSQVKLDGFRIELEEIEAALRRHPDVTQSVALVREDARGARRLVAYICWRADAQESPAGLRQALQKQLPEYMLPSAFISVPRIPLTANGKIDRKALPVPESKPETGRLPLARPQAPIERSVARIWEEALGVDEVGIDENFFELGGRSMLVVQVVQRIRQELDVPLTSVDLFHHPTVRGLARRIDSSGDAPASDTREIGRMRSPARGALEARRKRRSDRGPASRD